MLNENVDWVCFHGIFDFAYLLKVLSGEQFLPPDEFTFQESLRLYFPVAHDVKTMADPWPSLQGSLAKLCSELGVRLA